MTSARALAFAIAWACAACAPNRGEAFERSLAAARQAYHDGRFDRAALSFDEAARTAKIPRDGVYARYEAALARARSGDVAEASRELRVLADAKPPTEYSAAAAFQAAELAYRSDPTAGRAELEAMALRFPADGDAKVALARVLRDDDEGGADKTLAHLEELRPRVAGTPLEELWAYERAKRLLALGRLPAAREAFLDVAARWPYPHGVFFDDALYHAAAIDEQLGRKQEAIAELERLLSFRESSVTIGSYERPRYVPAMLRIARLYEELDDRVHARESLHRLYRDFTTSTMRDDALWREAQLFGEDGDQDSACDRLATLTTDFPDSRYVPCAIDRCPRIRRPSKSKAPATCHAYLTRKDWAPEQRDGDEGGEKSRP